MKTTTRSDGEGVTLRRVRESDVAALARLEKESGQEEWWDERQFRMLLPGGEAEEAGWLCAVAELADGTPAGYVAFERRPGHSHVVRSLAVRADRRRLGLGSRLLAVSLLTAREAHAMVRARDLPAQLCLKKCGFRWVRTDENAFDCPPDDGYLFRWRRDEPTYRPN